uniref:Elongation factor Ts, mitochondrial n=2 Tax=Rhizophora mucronata TaxID=61149 RepID=A0A2P2L738_RHIMU
MSKEIASQALSSEESAPDVDQIVGEVPQTDGVKTVGELDSPEEIASQALSSEVPVSDKVAKSQYNIATDENTFNSENEISSETAVDNEGLGATADDSGSITAADVQQGVASHQQTKDRVESLGKSDSPVDTSNALTSEGQNDEEVQNRVENTKGELLTEAPAAENEFSPVLNEDERKVESASEKNDTNSNPNGHSASLSSKENGTKVTISPALVKQLREETGAGMMDCKKALSETGGDIVKAQKFLRKKGLASAEKKASRATAEGRIGSYIHDSRIGVLIEVNCETDFVSRGDIFKDLVDDLAMQVAACPQVQYLVTEDVPEEIVNKEREIEMQKEDLLSKPEQIRSRIVEGRIKKRLEELALLEQPYIKNDKVVVKDWVKQTIATIGENIKVKRFVRYNLGEGLEKKNQDFAAEVAAQSTAKVAAAPANEQPVKAEAKEISQKPPTVTVSAALVKQLREETGAGMMDCKKALSETDGDLEKAQEYLRKKGLSTADKKSSRLAAEGRIGSYIHDSRIGVLIEVNCETDFVGRSEKFKELVDDLAMQVVACPQVQFVSVEDIPESIVKMEKELEMQREDLLSKPENIREKIVEGRISKRLGELALLAQPFIKNDGILVKELVKQTVAALGENIKVRRFVRFTLGETAEGARKEAEA